MFFMRKNMTDLIKKKLYPKDRKKYIKRNFNIGLTGFILSIISLLLSSKFTIPAIIVCVFSFFRKEKRKLPLAGLLICTYITITWLFFDAPITYSHPIDKDRYRMMCKGDFWLEFDPIHIEKTFCSKHVLGTSGMILFQAENPNTYQSEIIVPFAEKHGWVSCGKANFTKEEIFQYKEYEGGEDKVALAIETVFTGYNTDIIWIMDTCTVFAFDTEHYGGVPSFVVIRNDGMEMLVRDNSNVFVPDSSEYIMLPEIFRNEKNMMKDINYYSLAG